MALVVDSGALYAAVDRNDTHHRRCRELLAGTAERILIPAPVLVEVDQLIYARLHAGIFLALLDDIAAGAYEIEPLIDGDYTRARELCARYEDARVGFVDAAVLAVVERLNEPKLATLDQRHFNLMRPRHVDALRLLPE